MLREVSTDFTVDARALTKTGGPHVKARVVNPSGATTDTYVTDHGDGTYRVDYTPYEDGEEPLPQPRDPSKLNQGTPKHPETYQGSPSPPETPPNPTADLQIP